MSQIRDNDNTHNKNGNNNNNHADEMADTNGNPTPPPTFLALAADRAESKTRSGQLRRNRNNFTTTTTTGAAADSGAEPPATATLADYHATATATASVDHPGPQEDQDQDTPETEPEDKEPLPTSTSQVMPVQAIAGGLIALEGHHYTSLVKISGLNAKLMSGGEKHSLVRRLAGLFNSTSNTFAVYCLSKPRSMKPFITRLDKKRLALKPNDQNLRAQSWIVRDDLVQKERDQAITQREYYIGYEASSADIKSAHSGGNSYNQAGEDTTDPASGEPGQKRKWSFGELVEEVNTRLQIYLFGKDPDELALQKQEQATGGTGKGRGRSRRPGTGSISSSSRMKQDKARFIHPKIPTGLRDTLGFKAESYADQLALNGLGGKKCSDGETLRMLCEQFATVGKLTPEEIKELTELALNDPGGRAALTLDAVNLLSRADFAEYKNYLKLGEDYITSLIVSGYPRNLRLGQLSELIRFKHIRMAVALHVRPLSVKEAETKLKGRQQMLVAVEVENKSQTGNLDRLYKLESIKQLRAILASGDGKIFQVCIVISVRSRSYKRMKEDLTSVAQRLSEKGFEVIYPNGYQRRAFLSSIPLGHNFLTGPGLKVIADRITHPNLTAENVACLLPNCVSDFTQPGGYPLGRNKDDGSLVTFNRWIKSATNPHTVIIATTGGGKTVTQMWELLNEYLKNPDMEGHIIDIQNVLGPFAKQVGGLVIDLSLAGKACINPLDRYVCLGKPETIGERLSFMYALVTLMIKSELAPVERRAISNATKRLYHHFEGGESAMSTVYANFANNPFYAPLQPYLLDYQPTNAAGQPSGPIQPGIMTRLRQICDYLREAHQIPATGLVEGHTDPITGQFSRPICRLFEGRWYYCGEGMTNEPYEEPEEVRAIPPDKSRPPAVWYPHPEWWQGLFDEYRQMVVAEELFEALDETAREPAIRDAALDLKLGQPILGDLLPYLVAEGATGLAANLEQYCDGEMFGPIFNGYTNVDLDSRFISWNCKDLDEGTLRPIRMFQVVNLIWARVRAFRKRRMFICDEFQTLVQNYTDVANFVRDLFQRGRAFRLSMTAIVQNVTALLDYPQALICCQNAERTVLLKQQATAIDRLQLKYDLTDGEVEILKAAPQGQALMKVGNHNWVQVQYELPHQHLKSWDTNTDAEADDDLSFEEDELLAAFAFAGEQDYEAALAD